MLAVGDSRDLHTVCRSLHGDRQDERNCSYLIFTSIFDMNIDALQTFQYMIIGVIIVDNKTWFPYDREEAFGKASIVIPFFSTQSSYGINFLF